MTDAALSLAETDEADGAIFERFFAAYQQAFTLPDETEDRDGFAACLALNRGQEHARLAARFGEFRELCVIASDAGGMVGGANFIAIAPDPALLGAPVTANLNYLYVCPEARGRGALRRFLAALHRRIGTLFGGGERPVALFIEQNDPFRMSREAYERDSAHSGMDQFDRLRIWLRMDARVVDFPYVQPPLSAEQEADETLIYSVMGIAAPEIPAALLRRHLAAFFGISVLKGAPLEAVPSAIAQLDALDRMAAAGQGVALLDAAPLLGPTGDPAALLDRTDRPQDFRSALASILA
ncbi:MAG: hypothetical protein P0Y56_02835 [Candidatus Andeanibacterium colombiense]|uniref:N-acetyltransferase domain-containing protein n=1 Tax=Candidatus Andeanibacterium colombiense TaxID=3121345 RepID=A0AAJ5X7N3_9SPHN|nr:MAG: hypothetical protein P0Y56_02835 [Sphingomonadaceae bacterium]